MENHDQRESGSTASGRVITADHSSPMPPPRAGRGKIARLPLALRQSLNVRLQNGHPHAAVAEWLNTLAEVQALVASDFDGFAVTTDNVDRWRSGGYVVWESQQRSLEAVALLVEESGHLAQASPDSIANRVAAVLTAQLALQLQHLEGLPPGEEKALLWNQLLGALVLLRRGDLHAEKLRSEKERFEHRKFRNENEFEDALLRWAGRPGNRDRLRELLFAEDTKSAKEKRLESKARVARVKEVLGVP